MNKTFCITLLTTFTLVNMYAQDIITDRPDQTESSSTVPRGKLQWETGFSWEILKADYPDNDLFSFSQFSLNSSLLRYGLLKRFELRFGWDYLYEITRVESPGAIIFEDKADHFEPVYIGGKMQLSKESKGVPELALLGHITIPSHNISRDAGQIQPDLTLAGSYSFSSNMGIGINLGLHWPGFGKRNPNLFYSAVLGISHTEKLSSFWEFYAFRHEMLENLVYYEAGLSKNDLRADFGFTYLIRPNFQLDLSSGLGFSKISPDFFISTGFSWRIPA